MSDLTTLLLIAAVFAYLAGFIRLWRQRAPLIDPSPASGLTLTGVSSHQIDSLFFLISGAAVVLHSLLLSQSLFVPGGLNLSLVTVSNVVALVMLGAVLVCNVRLPVHNLNIFLLPIALFNLTSLALAADRPVTVSAALSDAEISHVILSISAYAVLMTAALQSLLLAFQERRLKHPTAHNLAFLPALETIERLLLAMLWIGTGLLTLSIVPGFIFLEDMFAQHVVHHTILTTCSWLVYSGFLIGHHFVGWRGITAIRWNLAAFGFLMLGYLGSKFVIEYLLQS